MHVFYILLVFLCRNEHLWVSPVWKSICLKCLFWEMNTKILENVMCDTYTITMLTEECLVCAMLLLQGLEWWCKKLNVG